MIMQQNTTNQIGFGTWKLKDNIETTEIVINAINKGYRLIDTASIYGNEKAIGDAIKRSNRKELLISGKLWNDDRNNVIEACKKTIKKLQCDYLDLYLMHWPASKAIHNDWKDINNYVWQQMEELVKLGLAKNIGVSNFKTNQLLELIKNADIIPSVNQIECHIGFMQNDILLYCYDKGIVVQAWSPLGSGKILKNEEIVSIAKKYNKTTAQICLKWCIQNRVIPIVKTTNIDRMESNMDIFNFIISDEDMNYLNAISPIGASRIRFRKNNFIWVDKRGENLYEI